MASPTFISYTETTWTLSSSGKTTASISVQSGDVLVAICVVEDFGTTVTSDSTISGGSLTWTRQQLVQVSSFCQVSIWTATATSNTSFAVSGTKPTSGSNLTPACGFGVYVFRNATIGGSNKTNVASGAPSLSLTTTSANSAIIAVNGDWNAVNGSSRTWRTINSITPTAGNGLEKSYFLTSGVYAVYTCYWNDVGAAGGQTTGLSAPTGQKYSIAAIEIKGISSGNIYAVNTSFDSTDATIINSGKIASNNILFNSIDTLTIADGRISILPLLYDCATNFIINPVLFINNKIVFDTSTTFTQFPGRISYVGTTFFCIDNYNVNCGNVASNGMAFDAAVVFATSNIKSLTNSVNFDSIDTLNINAGKVSQNRIVFDCVDYFNINNVKLTYIYPTFDVSDQFSLSVGAISSQNISFNSIATFITNAGKECGVATVFDSVNQYSINAGRISNLSPLYGGISDCSITNIKGSYNGILFDSGDTLSINNGRLSGNAIVFDAINTYVVNAGMLLMLSPRYDSVDVYTVGCGIKSNNYIVYDSSDTLYINTGRISTLGINFDTIDTFAINAGERCSAYPVFKGENTCVINAGRISSFYPFYDSVETFIVDGTKITTGYFGTIVNLDTKNDFIVGAGYKTNNTVAFDTSSLFIEGPGKISPLTISTGGNSDCSVVNIRGSFNGVLFNSSDTLSINNVRYTPFSVLLDTKSDFNLTIGTLFSLGVNFGESSDFNVNIQKNALIQSILNAAWNCSADFSVGGIKLEKSSLSFDSNGNLSVNNIRATSSSAQLDMFGDLFVNGVATRKGSVDFDSKCLISINNRRYVVGLPVFNAIATLSVGNGVINSVPITIDCNGGFSVNLSKIVKTLSEDEINFILYDLNILNITLTNIDSVNFIL